MHMADALLSPVVGVGMCVVSAGTIAYAVDKIKKEELSEKKLPIMAVTGAFVFAAQMINFTIPATGSSGHIGGGILLAALLGSFPALLTIAAVLIIQCLFFADGGLLALGCNIFNMGVIPCLIVYPLFLKPFLQKGFTIKRLSLGAVVSVVVGLQLGAFGVVLETLVSGITKLPFITFVLLMQPIHLAIGLVEGIVTSAVLCFVYQMRPEILESAVDRTKMQAGVSIKKLFAVFAVVTLCVGGGLSIFASSYPDGLEWSMEKTMGSTELETEGKLFEAAAEIQQKTALMPDYTYASEKEASSVGTMTAGVVGSIITFAVAGLLGFIISKTKKQKKVIADK